MASAMVSWMRGSLVPSDLPPTGSEAASTAMTVVTCGGEAGLVDVEDLDDEVTDDLEAR